MICGFVQYSFSDLLMIRAAMFWSLDNVNGWQKSTLIEKFS
jgi:hypothetical protein